VADFIKIEGVTLPLRIGSFTDSPDFLGIDERAQSGRLFSEINSQNMSATGTIKPRSSVTGAALTAYLNGEGETWLFASASEYGSRASAPNAGGSYTLYGSAGKFAGRVLAASGNYISLPALFTGDWTLDLWKYETIADEGAASDGWYRYTIRGNGTSVTTTNQVRDGSQGSHSAEDWLTVDSSGNALLYGKAGYTSGGGSNAARDYSMVSVRRSQMSDGIAQAMHDFSAQEIAGLPYYYADGEGIDGGPIEVKCRANTIRHLARGAEEAWDKSAREIEVSIKERG